MKKSHSIAYYITAHGYGHGVRSTDILRALLEMYPGVDVTVVTDLPSDFLRSRLPARTVQIRAGSFDVGMVQLDSIRVDLPATLQRVTDLLARREALVQQEVDYLKAGRFSAVVADIPSIPLEAAAKAGIPRLAVGNFAWDWIYEEFAANDDRWNAPIEQIREGYAKADLLLRLPFSEDMTAFPKRFDLPLVASPGKPCRDQLAAASGADPSKTWVLLSFTSLDWNDDALKRVARLTKHEFFTVKPLAWEQANIHPVDRHAFPFSDVIATCDVVISKPGFGILSECAVNRKPLIYAERTDFREYAVLVQAVEKYLKHQHIPADRLYRGDIGPALEAIATAPPPPRSIKAGGDQIAAQKIASFL